jgi:ribonuclease Z
MHGDHIFGLPGLITSYNHYGRSAPLTIYGPPGIRDFIMTSLKYTGNPIAFPMDIIEFNPASEQLLTEKDDLRIYTLPLVHRIPTAGFRLESIEKEYHLIPEALEKYNIPIDVRKELKTGKDYIDPEGNIIPNANFTTPPRQSWKYAYISDTAFVPEIVTKIRNYDLIYHEATFHTLFSAKARDTKHSTAAQAATIARNAGVKELIIGHFSSRYKDLNVLLLEAKALFPNTHLAIEGKSFDID